MKTWKKFQRFGMSFSSKPWHVEVSEGPPSVPLVPTMHQFREEWEADAFMLTLEGHSKRFCNLVTLFGDEMALCTCGVENDCVRCGGDGVANNMIDPNAEDPEDTEFPVCSDCFGRHVLGPQPKKP